jgi:hypothetical protein
MIDKKTTCTLTLKNCRLPFPGVSLEYQNTPHADDGGTVWFPDSTVLLVDDLRQYEGGNSYVMVYTLWKRQGVWIPSPVAFVLGPETTIRVCANGDVATDVILIPVGGGAVIKDAESDRAIRELADEISVVAHFALLCNCDNVRPVKAFTPSPALVKRARERGKLPPDEYYVLDCFTGEHREHGEAIGGSHASPRFHVRRGHIRRLPNGRLTWVKHCTVGDAALGRIVKDYRVPKRATAKVAP